MPPSVISNEIKENFEKHGAWETIVSLIGNKRRSDKKIFECHT